MYEEQIPGTTLKATTCEEWSWSNKTSSIRCYLLPGRIVVRIRTGVTSVTLLQKSLEISVLIRDYAGGKLLNVTDSRQADVPPDVEVVKTALDYVTKSEHTQSNAVVVGPRMYKFIRAAQVFRPALRQHLNVVKTIEDGIEVVRNSAQEKSLRERAALAYKEKIDEDPSQNAEVVEFCNLHGINRAVLWQQFRRDFGQSPKQYHLKQRVTAAMPLLGTERDIATIARMCGFSDSAHFSRSFRKVTGSTPTSFRSKTREAIGT